MTIVQTGAQPAGRTGAVTLPAVCRDPMLTGTAQGGTAPEASIASAGVGFRRTRGTPAPLAEQGGGTRERGASGHSAGRNLLAERADRPINQPRVLVGGETSCG